MATQNVPRNEDIAKGHLMASLPVMQLVLTFMNLSGSVHTELGLQEM